MCMNLNQKSVDEMNGTKKLMMWNTQTHKSRLDNQFGEMETQPSNAKCMQQNSMEIKTLRSISLVVFFFYAFQPKKKIVLDVNRMI